MNEIQEKTYNLLKEVANLCRKNNIKYFLGLETLALAKVFGGHSNTSTNLDIIIHARDMQKFVDVVNREARSDRALDYMGSNKNYISFDIEYVDKTTTFLEIGQGFNRSCYGARVSIIPLRGKPNQLISKWLELLETGWECNGFRLTKTITLKRIISAAMIRVAMIIGKRRLAKLLFKSFCKAYSKRSSKFILKASKKTRVFADKYFFSTGMLIKFEDYNFSCPINSEKLLLNFTADLGEEILKEKNINIQEH